MIPNEEALNRLREHFPALTFGTTWSDEIFVMTANMENCVRFVLDRHEFLMVCRDELRIDFRHVRKNIYKQRKNPSWHFKPN